jgi:predicted TIM-barrel fold metal-dependent hydrolase
MLPSEYFKRQCWISYGPEDPTLVPTIELLGDDRIVWATDYPHLDRVYPGAVKTLTDTLAPLPTTSRDRIAGENALAAYGLAVD